MGATDRMRLYLEKKGISKYSFYKTTGLSNKFLDNSSNMGTDKAEIIIRHFPDINIEWLITGEGNMIKATENEIQVIHTPPYIEKREDQVVYLYDVFAAANLKTLLINKDQNILGEIIIPDAPKCDGAVYVSGDSMYPLLKAGDIVAYKGLNSLDYLVFGEMYLISFDMDGDEFLSVKYIQKARKNDHLKLVSYNPHHEPMEIPKTAIRALAIVKFSIRKNTMN